MRLVFLHGWGQSSRIWTPIRPLVEAAFPGARYPDLPGHGRAAPAPADAWLWRLTEEIVHGDEAADAPVCLVGWSLGGMLAMRLALAMPARVGALALVATTPRFRVGEGWPHGCEAAWFDDFRRALAGDARLGERFFLLMLRGAGMPRARMRALSREVLDKAHPPARDALETGLDWLAREDLRDAIGGIRQPALVIHGREDAIVPEGAGRWLARHLPDARLAMIGGGHAPFLADPQGFVRALRNFLEHQDARETG